MAGSLNNPKKFSIDDAFEEGYDDAIRVYGSTTERSPLKPKEKVGTLEDNVTVWIENPNEQRLRSVADDVISFYYLMLNILNHCPLLVTVMHILKLKHSHLSQFEQLGPGRHLTRYK